MRAIAAAVLVLVLLAPALPIATAACGACFRPTTGNFQMQRDSLTGDHLLKNVTVESDIDLDAGTFVARIHVVGRNYDDSVIEIDGTLSLDHEYTLDATVRGHDRASWKGDQGYWYAEWEAHWVASMATKDYDDYVGASTFGLQAESPGAKEVTALWYGPMTYTYTHYETVDEGKRFETKIVPGTTHQSNATMRLKGPLGFEGLDVPVRGKLVDVGADVEITRKGSATPVKAREGMIVFEGDTVATLDEDVTIDFPYGTLQVGPNTNLRIDEFTRRENLAKTQVFLNVGRVQAHTRHDAAIRSDIGVATPGANSAIRGSTMIVAHDNATNQTRVYAVEDKAYVTTAGQTTEVVVEQGQRVHASGADLSAPAPYAAEELPPFAPPPEPSPAPGEGGRSPGKGVPGAGVALALAAVAGVAITMGLRRRR